MPGMDWDRVKKEDQIARSREGNPGLFEAEGGPGVPLGKKAREQAERVAPGEEGDLIAGRRVPRKPPQKGPRPRSERRRRVGRLDAYGLKAARKPRPKGTTKPRTRSKSTRVPEKGPQSVPETLVWRDTDDQA